MSTPAIIYLVICGLASGLGMTMHGKMHRYNYWANLFLSIPIWGLLYWGGFFS